MLYIFLLFVHFVADFIFQKDADAKGKSKSFEHLFNHIVDYFLYTTLILLIVNYFWNISNSIMILEYTILVSLLHLITDYFTSKVNSYLYQKNVHDFFVGVGFDQFLHQLQIYMILQFILGIK